MLHSFRHQAEVQRLRAVVGEDVNSPSFFPSWKIGRDEDSEKTLEQSTKGMPQNSASQAHLFACSHATPAALTERRQLQGPNTSTVDVSNQNRVAISTEAGTGAELFFESRQERFLSSHPSPSTLQQNESKIETIATNDRNQSTRISAAESLFNMPPPAKQSSARGTAQARADELINEVFRKTRSTQKPSTSQSSSFNPSGFATTTLNIIGQTKSEADAGSFLRTVSSVLGSPT